MLLLLLLGMEFHCKSKRFNMTYIVGPCILREKRNGHIKRLCECISSEPLSL